MASKTGLKVSDMTDSQRKSIGNRVIKMKKAGNGWPEIIKATGIAGGMTGRKLMREFGGKSAESLIRNSYDRQGGKGTAKKASTKAKSRTSSRGSTTATKSRARGGSATKTRNKGRRTK